MTTSKKLPVVPGDQIHFLESGVSFNTSDNFSSGHVSRRGETITITENLIEASVDRLGNSWLQKLNDPTETRFAKGPWPASESLWVTGSPEWAAERERRRTAAHSIPDEHERAKALRAVNQEFGPAATGQRSIKIAASTNLPQRAEV